MFGRETEQLLIVKTLQALATNRPSLKGLSLIAQFNFQRAAGALTPINPHPKNIMPFARQKDKKTSMPNHIFSTRHLSFELSSGESLSSLPPTVRRVQLKQSILPPLRVNKDTLAAANHSARVFSIFLLVLFSAHCLRQLPASKRSLWTCLHAVNTLIINSLLHQEAESLWGYAVFSDKNFPLWPENEGMLSSGSDLRTVHWPKSLFPVETQHLHVARTVAG